MQRALETYRLPYTVSKKHGLPRRIGQCFCYLTDISLREELMQELEARLAESKYLIVLCSPRSAKSSFVNGGIERFIELGRRDSIIPLIVDGIPYSGDPDTECYPEALRKHFPKSSNPFEDHQILGVNLHEEGLSSRRAQQRAVVMVIARMLGLNFEDLWRRELKRRRQLAAMWTTLIVCMAALVCFTWQISRSFDMDVVVSETTPPNPYLPQMDKLTVSLFLDGDTRTDTLYQKEGIFRHIPASCRGKELRLQAQCDGFCPLDTIVRAGESILLNIRRNEAIYGHLSAIVWHNDAPLKRASLRVADHLIATDSVGRFTLDLPIDEQRPAYSVFYQEQLLDSLYAPCGPNDVIVVP